MTRRMRSNRQDQKRNAPHCKWSVDSEREDSHKQCLITDVDLFSVMRRVVLLIALLIARLASIRQEAVFG